MDDFDVWDAVTIILWGIVFYVFVVPLGYG